MACVVASRKQITGDIRSLRSLRLLSTHNDWTCVPASSTSHFSCSYSNINTLPSLPLNPERLISLQCRRDELAQVTSQTSSVSLSSSFSSQSVTINLRTISRQQRNRESKSKTSQADYWRSMHNVSRFILKLFLASTSEAEASDNPTSLCVCEHSFKTRRRRARRSIGGEGVDSLTGDFANLSMSSGFTGFRMLQATSDANTSASSNNSASTTPNVLSPPSTPSFANKILTIEELKSLKDRRNKARQDFLDLDKKYRSALDAFCDELASIVI